MMISLFFLYLVGITIRIGNLLLFYPITISHILSNTNIRNTLQIQHVTVLALLRGGKDKENSHHYISTTRF